jgi:hypothetical protein
MDSDLDDNIEILWIELDWRGVVWFSLWYYASVCVSELTDTVITYSTVSSLGTVELFLCLIKHHTMKVYEGEEVKQHSFLTLTLECSK